VYVILVLLVLLASLYGIYKYSLVYASEIYTNKFVVAQAGTGISGESSSYLDKAVSFYATDEHLRLYTQIYLNQINQMVEQVQNNAQVDQAVLSDLINKTVVAATSAYNYDPYLLENNLLLAQVYATFERIGVDGAEGKAMELLNDAKKRFAIQPEIPVMKAQIALAKADTAEALEFIKEALAMKQNFVDAILLQAQVIASQGNIEESIATLEAGVIQNPQDPTLLNQLGLQYFSIKRFDLASTAFYRVVQLAPQEITTRYLLAISLYESGDRDAALVVIKDLQSVYTEDAVIQDTYQRMLDGTYSSSVQAEEPVVETEETATEE
jgi:tetratricopeptide (TPR) repeat protein